MKIQMKKKKRKFLMQNDLVYPRSRQWYGHLTGRVSCVSMLRIRDKMQWGSTTFSSSDRNADERTPHNYNSWSHHRGVNGTMDTVSCDWWVWFSGWNMAGLYTVEGCWRPVWHVCVWCVLPCDCIMNKCLYTTHRMVVISLTLSLSHTLVLCDIWLFPSLLSLLSNFNHPEV